MRKKIIFILTLGLFYFPEAESQSRFFKQYWSEYNGNINNTNGTGRPDRPRVGDRGMSTDADYYERTEAQVNGLVMIGIPDTIRNLDHADLYLELWGGHPGTANKRFQVNGGKVYRIPDEPTMDHNCEYTYPVIRVDHTEFVMGNNAIQFGCDRGTTFWGHFIIDQLAVRCYLSEDDPVITGSGLKSFSAKPVIHNKSIQDQSEISLEFPDQFRDQIVSVHYFAKYSGYDENGSGKDNQWHGYTHDRIFRGHIGTSDAEPYRVIWNTSMIPEQPVQMAIKALIEMKSGIFCWSDILDGLTFPLNRPHVRMFYCTGIPRPFWSRNNQLRTAEFELPEDLSKAKSAELNIRIWDGGEGEISEPFRINGVPYKITTGKAVHDIVYTKVTVDIKDLLPGSNRIELLSDTEHHGIEVCWPGPAIVIRYK